MLGYVESNIDFKLIDFYHETINFNQKKVQLNPNIKININNNFDFLKNDEQHTMKTVYTVTVTSSDDRINLVL